MDNLDEGLIKLVNHKDHPTNKAYKVFFFYKKHEAEHFKTLLLKFLKYGTLITSFIGSKYLSLGFKRVFTRLA